MIDYLLNMLFCYMLRCQNSLERKSMAKIIKVGSQNPTFTSRKASSIQTHRNSNESTNPFKFTNFEGKTLPFECADVFESFKPKSSNKLRIIASSVAGSMNKILSNPLAESIINFARRVRGAWNYAFNTNFSTAMSDAARVATGAMSAVVESSLVRKTNEILNAEIPLPSLNLPALDLTSRLSGLREGISAGVDFFNTDIVDIGKGISEKVGKLAPAISFHARPKYSTMSVQELELAWNEQIALGGIE